MNLNDYKMNEKVKEKKNFLFLLKLFIIFLLLLIDTIIFIFFHLQYLEGNNAFHFSQQANNTRRNSIYKNNDVILEETDLFINTKFNIKNYTKINYSSFEALYKTNKRNEKVILINKLYNHFIEEIIIENNKIKQKYEYFFQKPGEYHIYFTFKNIDKLNTTELMFYNINNLVSISFNQGFFKQNIKSLNGMFKNCYNLKYINFNNNIFTEIKDLSNTFQNCISLISINFSNIINNATLDISYMFSNCSSLSSIDFSTFDTINIRNMSGLFYNCSSLASIDLTKFKTVNVLSMDYMFAGCSLISSVNIAFLQLLNIIDIRYMFKNCLNLTSVKLPNLEKNRKVKTEGLFYGCNNLNKKKYDVCILGSWFAYNYGCMSTYYALHQTVKNLGYSILMLESPRDFRGKRLDKCHPFIIGKQLYNISKHRTFGQLHEYNDECKTFLVGSDQIWRPSISGYYHNFFYLNFVYDYKKKISYSTSFGDKLNITEKEKRLIKKYLIRFNSISVRDRLSFNITKNGFNIKKVAQVCDPTFICNFSEYENLIKKSKVTQNDEYILAYILDPTKEKGHRLEKLSLQKNISIIILLEENQYLWKSNKEKLHLRGIGKIFVKEKVDLNDFMFYYNNSKAVFTDSFHGTVFSIIFKKPFVTLRNIKRGGERFSSLLDPLDLSNRLFETPSCINDHLDLYDKIDYEIPYQNLNKIKNFSYNWLKNALKD